MKPDEIRELRLGKLGWTQRQLAEHLGITVIAVSHWEQGLRSPNRDHSAALDELRETGEVKAATK